MKKIKVAEATNTQLDWLVAKCEGHTQETTVFPNGVRSPRIFIDDGGVAFDALIGAYLGYTGDWSQMGPLIHKHKITIEHDDMFEVDHTDPDDSGARWMAKTLHTDSTQYEHDALVAAARVLVLQAFGTTAEVPEELP